MAIKINKLTQTENIKTTDEMVILDGAHTLRTPSTALTQVLNAGNLKMPDSDETIAEHYRQFCNRNLLDNWYFANPVNQRGATEYIINRSNQYHIDKWTAAGNFKITLENDGLKITNTSDSVYANIMQRLEFARFGKKERTVTLSLFTGDDLYSVTGTVSFQDQNGSCFFATPFGAIRMYTYNSLTEFTIDVAPGKETKIQAVKLELGSNQTLAHKENNVWVLNEIPDYATELAKCQRYQAIYSYPQTNGFGNATYIAVGIANSTTTARFSIETPAPLRTKPAVSMDGFYALRKTLGRVKASAATPLWPPIQNKVAVQVTCDEANFTVGEILFLESFSGAALKLDANL